MTESQDDPVLDGAYYMQNAEGVDFVNFDPETDQTDRLIWNQIVGLWDPRVQGVVSQNAQARAAQVAPD